MKRLVAALVAVTVLAGCSSSGGHSGSTSPPPASSPLPSDVTYASPAEAEADACAIFDKFYNDLMTLTPHAWLKLNDDLGDAHHGIVQAALASNSDKLFSDANDLVMYVGASAFPTSGNVLGAPIQAMQDDCH